MSTEVERVHGENDFRKVKFSHPFIVKEMLTERVHLSALHVGLCISRILLLFPCGTAEIYYFKK